MTYLANSSELDSKAILIFGKYFIFVYNSEYIHSLSISGLTFQHVALTFVAH